MPTSPSGLSDPARRRGTSPKRTHLVNATPAPGATPASRLTGSAEPVDGDGGGLAVDGSPGQAPPNGPQPDQLRALTRRARAPFSRARVAWCRLPREWRFAILLLATMRLTLGL